MLTRRQIITTSLFAALASSVAAQTPATERVKVVFQISDDDPKRWNLVLNNVKNVQDELGKDKVDIEVVAYGPGLGILKLDSAVNSRAAATLSSGAKLIACENTMRASKIERADLIDGVSYVKAGVVHLVERQRAGWSYIRP